MESSSDNRDVNASQASGTSPSRRRYFFAAAGVLVTGALLAGALPRISEGKRAAADTQQLAVPTVSVISPTVSPPPDGLLLPAEVRPWQEASIYARVNGYLRSWYADIGTHVSESDLLAEIDTPDLDHQLEQARSQAALAQQSLELAKDTNSKWQQLWRRGVVSQLDAEEKSTSAGTSQANADAYAANLRVLKQQVAFKRVTAPFAGVITTRNANVGDLIIANNTNFEMFHVQQTDPLRIYFRVPQGNAGDIKVGQAIDVLFPEPVDKTVQAKVRNTSESIAPNSRTLLVQLQLDNSDDQIQPGSFAQVRLPANSLGPTLTVPNNTLLFRAQGLQVGVVKPDNTVELRSIKVGRDFGTRIEITDGVSPSDTIIVNPSDSLVTGAVVQVNSSPQQKRTAMAISPPR
jgi:membrane fusion protein, multidrug efflux system